MESQRLGEILVGDGIITARELKLCLLARRAGNGRLGEALKYYNFVDDLGIANALAKKVGWKVFTGEFVPDVEAVKNVGLEFFKEKNIFPLKTNKGCVFVYSVVDDTEASSKLNKSGYVNNDCCVGAEDQIRHGLDCLERSLNKNLLERDIAKSVNSDNLKKFVDHLLELGVSERASDIHIEPSKNTCGIRFRIDGVLYFVAFLPLDLHKQLINAMFYRAEKSGCNLAQFIDTRFSFEYSKREINVRISHTPSIDGGVMVLRLLDTQKSAISLVNLGYSGYHWNTISQEIIKPNGIILVTGPTGSGKSTTLYSILNHIKGTGKKAISIEDPVETKLSLVTQVQTNENQGISFEKAIPSFLRQDPDVMLIGEIRDQRTAKEAVSASITGHLVLSTLHTTKPIEAILRLKELGVDLSYIANSLNCIITQRLVRKLCPHCKTKLKASDSLSDGYFKQILGEAIVYMAGGCDYCIDGYRDRTVLAETIVIRDDFRKYIARGGIMKISEILGEDESHVTLAHDGQRLLEEGVTSLEEIKRILG